MRLTIHNLDRAALDHVRANLRDYDRRELEIQGYGDREFLAHLDHPYAHAYKADGLPVAVGGAVPFGTRIFLWAFGTDDAIRHMVEIHRIALGFLSWLARVEWQLLPSVLVWEGHDPSLRWLARLGFVDTGFRGKGVSNEKLLLLEKP